MSKKIMILGAGIYQVPLIKCAKEMGLYTIVVSIRGDYPGFKYADEILYLDTTDADAILEVAKENSIDGIVTTGTDVAVRTIGKVCDALGLVGVSENGAKIACDKMLMKKAFLENGVNTAEFYYVSVNDKKAYYEEISNKIGFPVIFKAVDSSGSRGITKVNSRDDIDSAVNAVRSVTRNDMFIIEKYLEGDEFGAQAFVQNGKVQFVLPHGDYVFKGDAGVPIGHYAPFDVKGLDHEIVEQTEKAIAAMGLDNCAINADFILCGKKVYVLEIGARCGATQLAELVSLYYGYNYYKKIIESSLGECVDFMAANKKRQPNASHLITVDKSGVIKSICNHNDSDSDIYQIQIDYKVGDEVHKFQVGPDRVGHVITIGDSLEDAQRKLFEVLGKIEVEVCTTSH